MEQVGKEPFQKFPCFSFFQERKLDFTSGECRSKLKADIYIERERNRDRIKVVKIAS